MAGREDGNMTHHVLVLAGQRVKLHNAVNLVAKELDPNRKFVVVGRWMSTVSPFTRNLLRMKFMSLRSYCSLTRRLQSSSRSICIPGRRLMTMLR